MMAASAGEFRPRLWVPGDWNAFFGLGTNVILNVIVLSSLVLGVIKLPEGIVFGRILPALGIALPLGNIFYAYLAYRLARAERRSDVAAMRTTVTAAITSEELIRPSPIVGGRRADGGAGHHDGPVEDRMIMMAGLDLGEEGAEEEREKDQGALGVPELQSHRQRITAGLAERRRENLDDPEG